MEQLGRKKKDKKLADLTTRFLPPFQKLKPVACLRTWESRALRVDLTSLMGEGGGSKPWCEGDSSRLLLTLLHTPEAGLARDILGGVYSFILATQSQIRKHNLRTFPGN